MMTKIPQACGEERAEETPVLVKVKGQGVSYRLSKPLRSTKINTIFPKPSRRSWQMALEEGSWPGWRMLGHCVLDCGTKEACAEDSEVPHPLARKISRATILLQSTQEVAGHILKFPCLRSLYLKWLRKPEVTAFDCENQRWLCLTMVFSFVFCQHKQNWGSRRY